MHSFGKYNSPIEIWLNVEQTNKNRLGNKEVIPTKIATIFANVEVIAETTLVTSSTPTHKISWIYDNYNQIIPHKHWIVYEGTRFDIDYVIDNNLRHEELQIFAMVK